MITLIQFKTIAEHLYADSSSLYNNCKSNHDKLSTSHFGIAYRITNTLI
jgi:hypothetical protein